MSKAKVAYYRSKLRNCANTSKATWDVISEVLGHTKNKGGVDELVTGENVCSDNKTIADSFNDFFTSVGTNLAVNFDGGDSFMMYLNQDIDARFDFEPVTLDEVEKTVRGFSNAASGYDDICITVYKEHFDLLGETLLLICNQSLSEGIFP